MATSDDYKNVRTLEEVSMMLNTLYYNMNSFMKNFYTIYNSPDPQTVTLPVYDDTGKLTEVTIENLASLKLQVYTSNGNPNGSVTAARGSLCLDTNSGYLYYKSVGTDAFGWILLYGTNNANFLAPDGDGSQLTSINANNIASGVLPVPRGGSGIGSISGLVKGNDTDSFSAAIDGTDYLGPSSFTGIICYYPISTIPTGWLKCDGSALSRVTYANLFNIIGTTYGAGDGSTTFNIPDLRDYFIRGWDGTRAFNEVQAAQVGGHTHPLSGSTGAGTAHSHTRGTMNITGKTPWRVYLQGVNNPSLAYNGALYGGGDNGSWWGRPTSENSGSYFTTIGIDASQSWTGETSLESAHTHTLTGDTGNNDANAENRVVNKAMVPIIKY